MVFAAASLTNVLSEIGKNFENENKIKVFFNFDASSKLAKQIENGAKADIFFSADNLWNEYLVQIKLVFKENTKELLSNDLVLITFKDSPTKIENLSTLPEIPFKHLATVHENVPAGLYASQTLKKLGIYKKIKSKIVTGENVRHVLAWVAKNEMDLGFVYATDAKVEPLVKVLLIVPSDLHEMILYPISYLGLNKASKMFFDYCQNSKSLKIYEKAGFKILP
jgi:molybdate transport system substrate-binding protein